jgi:DNA-binding transcriptional ArsR family regulator
MDQREMGLGVEELAERQADVFSVLSTAKRVRIIMLLDGTEMSVNEIASAIDASVQNTSQHLRLMSGKSILESRREGQTIYYRIADTPLGKHCQYILKESLAVLADEQ